MYEPIYLLGRNGYILVADFRLGLPRSRLASLSLSSSGDHGYRVFWAKPANPSFSGFGVKQITYKLVQRGDLVRRKATDIYIYI